MDCPEPYSAEQSQSWKALSNFAGIRPHCLRMAALTQKTVDSLQSILCVWASAVQCIKSFAPIGLWNTFDGASRKCAIKTVRHANKLELLA